MVLSSSWNRIIAIVTLLLIWAIWGIAHFQPGVTSDVLGKLPSLGGSTGSGSSSSGSANPTTLSNNGDTGRPLVLYTYAESDNARENLRYFLRNGLNARADFVFIFNGETDASGLLPSGLPNVRMVQRENTCYDIGAYGEVLRTEDLWKQYKRFILMNASVRGPFMPSYVPSCWMDAFLGRITDKVKLVGTTLNCLPRPHVQSMVLATDDVGMAILLDPALALSGSEENYYGSATDPGGLTPCYSTMHLAVHAEIGLMAMMESQGYKADVVMTAPHSQRTFMDFCAMNGWPDDFLYKEHYFGATVHPYETIFSKANRGMDPLLLDKLTEWHVAANMTSWDACAT